MAKPQLLFGKNILVEAIASRANIHSIYCENDGARRFVQDALKSSKGAMPRIQMGLPRQIQDGGHQGVAFDTDWQFYLPNWDADQNPFQFIILCNHLEDVQNLGGIVRSAAAFGVGLIVHEERRSVRLNATAIKISAGTAFKMKFLEVSNLAPFCQHLIKHGYAVTGLDAGDDTIPLFEWTPRFPQALIIGSEGAGMGKPVRGQCEDVIRIPMDSKVESLNATTAASIAMSWAFKDLKRSGKPL